MPNSRSVLLIMDFQHSILRNVNPIVAKYAENAARAARTNGSKCLVKVRAQPMPNADAAA